MYVCTHTHTHTRTHTHTHTHTHTYTHTHTRSHVYTHNHKYVTVTDNDPLDIAAEVIDNQRVLLSQKLSSDDLMDYHNTERLVDSTTGEKLGMMCFTPMEKNRMIITNLIKGPPGTLKTFCAILRKVKKYSYIADELEKGNQLFECISV